MATDGRSLHLNLGLPVAKCNDVHVGVEQWEHAVLTVELVDTTVSPWQYRAQAWVDEAKIYSEWLDSMYWTKPLAHLGRDGWELVGAVPENALFKSSPKGHPGEASVPVRMHYFLKRPVLDSRS